MRRALASSARSHRTVCAASGWRCAREACVADQQRRPRVRRGQGRACASSPTPPLHRRITRSPGGSAQGLPSGRDPPPTGVENVLIRAHRWRGACHARRHLLGDRRDAGEPLRPDSRLGRRTARPSSRSRTAAGTAIRFAYYRIDGATATKLDLRALVEPVMTARLPPRNRQGNSFSRA